MVFSRAYRFALVLCASALVPALELDHPSACKVSYDYIIVGGGTAGLVVANRLSTDPGTSVLVIEYGYVDNNASILIPQNINHISYVDFTNLTSAPLKNLNNNTFPINVGASVGGGSVVNGMYVTSNSRIAIFSKKLTAQVLQSRIQG